MAIAAVAMKGTVAEPAEPLTEAAVVLLGKDPVESHKHSRPYRWDRMRLAVFGTLLDSWLYHEGPLPIGELSEQADVSYPTVRVTLDALAARGEIRRTTSRSVELLGMPRRSLEELVPRLDELRETEFYVDASGREASAVTLLTRLRRKALRGVHYGGVSAARELWPGFNLNGTPRLDLTVTSEASQNWLQTLDPALQRVPQSSANVILAVHRARAPQSPEVSRARKATVVFDLYSLGLSEQAEDLIRHSRT